MASITELKDRFFVQQADLKPEEQPPDTSGGNHVEFFVHGTEFFGAIKQDIDEMTSALNSGGSNAYFYMNGWHLGLTQGPQRVHVGEITSGWDKDVNFSWMGPFKLQTASSAPTFLSQLESLSSKGVDVRSSVWISPFIASESENFVNKVGNMWGVNVHSILSVNELRKKTRHNGVILNTICHPFGAIHAKIVLSGYTRGDGVSVAHAYASGLDMVENRLGSTWHDVGVQIEGPAAAAIYRFYRDLWKEQLSRDVYKFRVATVRQIANVVVSHEKTFPEIPARNAPPPRGTSTQHIQVLRTTPRMNFKTGIDCVGTAMMGKGTPENWKFAEGGTFEFREALFKAVKAAQNYIYIEDQAFTTIELMKVINQRLIDYPALKVILLYGPDPADPPNTFMPEAISTLIGGVANPDLRVVFCLYNGKTVHSKLTIIDDTWVAVGSANCMRRSLYTDCELSVGILDESTDSIAKRMRKRLWDVHSEPVAGGGRDLDDIQMAFGLWNPLWVAEPINRRLLTAIQPKHVPFFYSISPTPDQWKAPRPVFDIKQYRQRDPDSRHSYGVDDTF